MVWGTTEIPDVLQVSDLPTAQAKILEWKKKQSKIFGLYEYGASFLMAFVANYYVFYDRQGNFINYVEAPKKQVSLYKNQLYVLTQSKMSEGKIINPSLEVWKIKH